MVKITNIPPEGRSTRRPGLVVTTTVRGGVRIMKSWPKKRGKQATPEQKHNQEQFALAQRAATECIPWQYLEAEAVSTGTIWNRREILVKASQGSLYSVELANGDYYGNWFEMAREIQGLLDTITDAPGDMLIRTPEGWVGLSAGADGYVLTSNGEGERPSWQAGASPDVAYQWSTVDTQAVYAGANPSLGNAYEVPFPIEITDINIRVTPDVGSTYLLTICEISAALRITAILQQFAITTQVNANPKGALIALPVPQILLPGVRYGFIVSRSNVAPGNGVKSWTSFSRCVPFPTVSQVENIYFNVAVPVINQLVIVANSQSAINMKWREL